MGDYRVNLPNASRQRQCLPDFRNSYPIPFRRDSQSVAKPGSDASRNVERAGGTSALYFFFAANLRLAEKTGSTVGIVHAFEIYEGDHVNRVAERIRSSAS